MAGASTTPGPLRHRVLGVDPGSRTTGFGVIDTDGNHSRRIVSGCIRVGEHPWPERLRFIFDAVAGWWRATPPTRWRWSS